jgi:hypothetical protein
MNRAGGGLARSWGLISDVGVSVSTLTRTGRSLVSILRERGNLVKGGSLARSASAHCIFRLPRLFAIHYYL